MEVVGAYPRKRGYAAPGAGGQGGAYPHHRHSGVGRNPVGAARRHRRGAMRPVSLTPKRRVIPAKAGTYPSCRHSRVGGNLAPKTRRRPILPSAQTALIWRSKALIQRSNGAHSALIRRSSGAQKRSPPPGLPPRRPGTIREARARSLTPRETSPFRALPKPLTAIMTQGHCAPLRPLLSCP